MKLFRLTTLALAAITVFQSCTKEDEAPAPGRVLVTHASPTVGGVDLLVDDVKQNTAALTFPNSTSYITVNSGARGFKINAAGTATSAINANFTVEASKNYSFFAINTTAAANSGVELAAFVDDLTAPATGKAHVRVIHLSPDAPAVNVGVTGQTSNLFTNIVYKGATAFLPVDAGTYSLQVRLASNNAGVLTIPNVVLASGKIYTIFARGYVTVPTGNTNMLGATIITNN